MTKVSKYKETPIVSMMGGYQRFFPLNKNQTPSVHVRSGRNAFTKTPMELFRTRPDPVTNTMGEATTGMIFNSEPVRGFYIGNHIISKQYSPVGTLPISKAQDLNKVFVNKFSGRGAGIIQRYASQLSPAFQGNTAEAIKLSGADAMEEQSKAVGGKTPRAGGSRAQKVDLVGVPNMGNIQVTTQRLDKINHHGIYGKRGQELVDNIKTIRKKFKGKVGEEDVMHEQIANEGLNYFKKRIPSWNKALMSFQENKKYRSGVSLRTAVHETLSKKGGVNTLPLDEVALRRVAGKSTEFFGVGAGQLVKQALGNMRYFGQAGGGVSYSYTINPYTFAVISKFLMLDNPYQFKVGALNSAEVVEGYTATDEAFSTLSGNGSGVDVAMKRAFAHTAHRVNKHAATTETGALNKAQTGDLATSSGRLYPSVYLVHADKNMAKFIKKGLIPQIIKDVKSQSKKFTGDRLGNSIPFFFGQGLTGWAAPYLSIADAEFELFGSSDPYR